MNADAYRAFLDLLGRLEHAKIFYRLSHPRAEAVMIEVVVPGERWEIELVDYGDEFHWEVERFRSDGEIENETAIDELFASFSDPIEEQVATNDHNA
jgi:hypothetical protein